jgi:ArsR family transcriptional regulator
MLMDERMTRLKRREPAPAWLNAEALAGAAETFKTLSDPTRLRLLLALMNGPSCVGDLCGFLQMSQPAVSHQLRLLRVSRLVSAQRVGREIFYSLDDEHVMSVVAAACTHAMER